MKDSEFIRKMFNDGPPVPEDEKPKAIEFDTLKEYYYYIISERLALDTTCANRKLSRDDYIWLLAILIRDLAEELRDV